MHSVHVDWESVVSLDLKLLLAGWRLACSVRGLVWPALTQDYSPAGGSSLLAHSKLAHISCLLLHPLGTHNLHKHYHYLVSVYPHITLPPLPLYTRVGDFELLLVANPNNNRLRCKNTHQHTPASPKTTTPSLTAGILDNHILQLHPRRRPHPRNEHQN